MSDKYARYKPKAWIGLCNLQPPEKTQTNLFWGLMLFCLGFLITIFTG